MSQFAGGVAQEAVRLYAAGMTGREVAAELAARGIRVDPTSVTRWAPESRRSGPRGRDDIDEWHMLGLHFAGRRPSEIAREMHLPRSTVRQRLARVFGLPRSAGLPAPGEPPRSR